MLKYQFSHKCYCMIGQVFEIRFKTYLSQRGSSTNSSHPIPDWLVFKLALYLHFYDFSAFSH